MVVEQVGMLSIIMLIGFVAAKTGYIDVKHKDSISKLIVNLILPCLIISSISAEEFKWELLGELGMVFLMSVFCIITLFIIGVVTAKILKIPDYTSAVHKLMSSTGNVIFIGYPIIVAMYGEQGFFYAIVYWLLNDLFLWTVGVLLLSGNKGGDKKQTLRKLLNPNTISFAVALVMFLFGIKLPFVVDRALSGVGALTTCLSMIFIGMALAAVNVEKIRKKWGVLVIAPIKLVIMPVIYIYIFKTLGINEIILGVVVLEAAMPAQTVLTILASEQKSDYEYAAVGLFITTILSILTLPFVCWLLRMWV